MSRRPVRIALSSAVAVIILSPLFQNCMGHSFETATGNGVTNASSVASGSPLVIVPPAANDPSAASSAQTSSASSSSAASADPSAADPSGNAPAAGAAPAAMPGVDVNGTFTFAGVARTYVLHIPSGYETSIQYPLMWVFHGHGGTGAGMEGMSKMDATADANGFFAIYPDSNPNYSDGKSWATTGTNSDVDYVFALLASLEKSYSIDAKQIYVSGFSEGGGMVQEIACGHAADIAGAAVVSENQHPNTIDKCKPSVPVNILFFHGTGDPISPYNGGKNGLNGATTLSAQATAEMWVKDNGCKASPVTTSFPDQLVDGTNVTDNVQVWSGCKNNVGVTFYTIGGGGHAWPGGGMNKDQSGPASQNLSADDIIWGTLASGNIPALPGSNATVPAPAPTPARAATPSQTATPTATYSFRRMADLASVGKGEDPRAIGIPYCNTESPKSCKVENRVCFIYSGNWWTGSSQEYVQFRCVQD